MTNDYEIYEDGYRTGHYQARYDHYKELIEHFNKLDANRKKSKFKSAKREVLFLKNQYEMSVKKDLAPPPTLFVNGIAYGVAAMSIVVICTAHIGCALGWWGWL